MWEFDRLSPHAAELLDVQRECAPQGPDHMALGIALAGRKQRPTTSRAGATSTVRRRHRRASAETATAGSPIEARPSRRSAPTPYADRLRARQLRCRPFGRDYCALDIARQSLETAAFHFTREAHFYGATGDSSGPVRPGV